MKKYEAKNLDEALKAAAADKHVKIEDLKYYVLEEKPGGLFGIGSKAIIEAYTFNDVRDFIESYLKQYFDNIGMNVELIVNKLDDNSFNVIVNANNNAIDVIEAEGCEGVLPGVLDFFLYCAYNPIWQAQNLGRSKQTAYLMTQGIRFMELLRNPINKEFRKTGGKFMLTERIQELAEKSSSVLSCGNSCGEGWFLTAEMIELIQDGVPNIICAQPFACLPNHVTGKGMIKELRRQYPNSNIIPIDYDPGASEANQLNRIKLMISTAHTVRNMEIEKEGNTAGDN